MFKPIVTATAATVILSACDGVPVKPYSLTQSGPADTALIIENATGQPLRFLSYSACGGMSIAETFLVEGAGDPRGQTNRWEFPATSNQCVFVQAYSEPADAWVGEKVQIGSGAATVHRID